MVAKTLQKVNFNNFAIVNIGRNGHRIHFCGMAESEAAHRMEKADLS